MASRLSYDEVRIETENEANKINHELRSLYTMEELESLQQEYKNRNFRYLSFDRFLFCRKYGRNAIQYI